MKFTFTPTSLVLCVQHNVVRRESGHDERQILSPTPDMTIGGDTDDSERSRDCSVPGKETMPTYYKCSSSLHKKERSPSDAVSFIGSN